MNALIMVLFFSVSIIGSAPCKDSQIAAASWNDTVPLPSTENRLDAILQPAFAAQSETWRKPVEGRISTATAAATHKKHQHGKTEKRENNKKTNE